MYILRAIYGQLVVTKANVSSVYKCYTHLHDVIQACFIDCWLCVLSQMISVFVETCGVFIYVMLHVFILSPEIANISSVVIQMMLT